MTKKTTKKKESKKTTKKATKKVELKTKKNKASVTSYINNIADEQKRKDAKEIHKIMEEVTKKKGVMWGSSIVGYGTYTYVYPTGRSADWMTTGWSMRAQNLTLYIMPGYEFENMKELLQKLGPHKTGKSCLYVKHLEDIHIPTLKKIIRLGLKELKQRYKTS